MSREYEKYEHYLILERMKKYFWRMYPIMLDEVMRERELKLQRKKEIENKINKESKYL
jgi:hypothetical protein